MTPPKIPFTPAKYAALQQKVTALNSELKEVMIRLKDAREMGDLSENGAYKYAKFEMGRIKRELRGLHDLLARGEAVTIVPSAQVQFGSLVTLRSAAGKLTEYQMVSQYESDPAAAKLSMDSPIGLALMGKRAGASVTVATPTGEVSFEVMRVG